MLTLLCILSFVVLVCASVLAGSTRCPQCQKCGSRRLPHVYRVPLGGCVVLHRCDRCEGGT